MASTTSTIKMELEGYTKVEFITFGLSALQKIHEADRDTYILDGLVRVDIFKNNEGNLVVNEFESLEARHFSNNHCKVIGVTDYLRLYWREKLYKCVCELQG